MTRTETDLRCAYEVAPDPQALARLTNLIDELTTPSADQLERQRGPHTAGRSRLVMAAAAAILVLGLAVVVPALLDSADRGAPTGGPTSTTQTYSPAQLRPQWTIALTPTHGYASQRVTAISSGTSRQTVVDITATSHTRPERGLLVEAPCTESLRDCSSGAGPGEKVTVSGHPGLWIPGHKLDTAHLAPSIQSQQWASANTDAQSQPQLFWTPRTGTVDSLIGSFGFDPATLAYDNGAARTIMMRLAAHVRTGLTEPVTMPFALPTLPSHLAPEAVQLARKQHCIGYGYGQQPGQREYVGSIVTACRVVTQSTDRGTIAAADGIDPTQTASVVVHNFPNHTSIVIEVDVGEQRYLSAAAARALAARADVRPQLSKSSTWLVVH